MGIRREESVTNAIISQHTAIFKNCLIPHYTTQSAPEMKKKKKINKSSIDLAQGRKYRAPHENRTCESMIIVILWGFDWRSRAKLCCRLISDSVIRLFYFTPRWLVGVTLCPRKSKKRNIQKKTVTDRRRRRFFYTFPLFPGFNNHFMSERVFPQYNWNGWIPQLRCLKIR